MKPENEALKAAARSILAGMVSPDATARQKASRELIGQPAEMLIVLAEGMNAPDPATTKASKLAMERLTHHLLAPLPGKDRPDARKQADAVDALTQILDSSSYPRMTRAYAVALLGFAGTKKQEKLLTLLESDPEIGEDARMARTRLKSAG